MEETQKTYPTYEDLLSKFNEEFNELKNLNLRRLDILIKEGKEDYKLHKGKWFTLMKLTNIYLKKGNHLERKADQEFYGLLDVFKLELSKYSYDTTIINDYEKIYCSYKEQLRKNFLQRAKKHSLS